jgi:hypothetical protein
MTTDPNEKNIAKTAYGQAPSAINREDRERKADRQETDSYRLHREQVAKDSKVGK